MRCITALVNMSIIFARLGFGADPAEGGGAYANVLKRPLPTFQKFHDTRPGALTRVSTVFFDFVLQNRHVGVLIRYGLAAWTAPP